MKKLRLVNTLTLEQLTAMMRGGEKPDGRPFPETMPWENASKMNMIVIPLSAAPPIPAPTTPQLMMNIMDHVLVVGLPLGILISRNANFKKA